MALTFNTANLFCYYDPKNCLGVFDYFVGLALKGLTKPIEKDTVQGWSM